MVQPLINLSQVKYVALAASLLFASVTARAELDSSLDWAGFYDPGIVRDLHLLIGRFVLMAAHVDFLDN